MTNEASRVFRFLRFVIPSSFVICLPRRGPAKAGHSSFSGNRNALRKKLWILHGTRHSSSSFTVLELLVVIGIIIALAGLILATVGYVQKKGARSRAEAEIAAISAACESYRADNGIYPQGNANRSTTAPYDTDALDPVTDTNLSTSSTKYAKASLYLYEELSGDHNADRTVNSSDDPSGVAPKTYMTFKPNMLLPAPPVTTAVTAMRDPFGNSYGYSTAKASNPSGSAGYNPTFDLWSTAGTTSGSATDVAQWIKNW